MKEKRLVSRRSSLARKKVSYCCKINLFGRPVQTFFYFFFNKYRIVNGKVVGFGKLFDCILTDSCPFVVRWQ